MFAQRYRLLKPSICTLALALFIAPQFVATYGSWEPTILTINGDVPNPKQLTASDLAKLPRRTVQIKNQDGTSTTYEGPLLADVLSTAGVTFGPDLKGPKLAKYLIITGADKFRVVFALPELDSSFTDRIIILADKRDGAPLSSAEGPLRNIIPDEKRISRSVKQVVTLTIANAPAIKKK
jgi:hypothetical protein